MPTEEQRNEDPIIYLFCGVILTQLTRSDDDKFLSFFAIYACVQSMHDICFLFRLLCSFSFLLVSDNENARYELAGQSKSM